MRMALNALISFGLAVAFGVVARGQTDATNTPEAHIAAAKTATQQDHIGLFNRVCCSLTPATQQGERGAPAA